MSLTNPLELSRWMLFSMGVRVSLHHAERLPQSPFLMIANHRSFLDAPLLITAAAQPIHFACHHYMSQVPVMNQMVEALGCFPLDGPTKRGRTFFQQATNFLRSHRSIGVFPEGTNPMVTPTPADQISEFHRGFAHLAFRAPVDELRIVPTAIVALEENQQATIPFRFLSLFDPSEPLFQQSGRHPAIIYRKVAVVIANPIPMTALRCEAYQGRQAGQAANDLTAICHSAVQDLLQVGCY